MINRKKRMHRSMVFPGERDYMATTRSDRSNNLHHFTLPNLRLGSQPHLNNDSMSSGGSGDHRLRRRSPPLKFSGSSASIPVRFGDADHRSNSKNEQHHRLRNVPFKPVDNGGSEEGIEEFRVKIMSDLKMVRDKITQSMFKKDHDIEKEDEERETDVSGSGQDKEKEVSPVKPWNLRKRRAVCKELSSGNKFNNSSNKGLAIEEATVKPSPSRCKERGEVAKAPETKLLVELSKNEIEEDFMAMLGRRPPRRPKKRPRTARKTLDNLFPELYMGEVTLDAYKVTEEAKNTKR